MMTNSWEVRERNHKRVALIISVIIHVFALVALTTGTGKTSTWHDLLEQVLGGEKQGDQLVQETKV